MYYIKCRCNQRYTFEPKENSNVFLCSCGRKIPKRKWELVIDGEFIEQTEALMVV